jgi:hypothetical protein
MNRWLLRILGIGAWANSAWDFNAYYVHGLILPYFQAHAWGDILFNWATVLCLYPVVGLFLIFPKTPLRMDISQGLDDIEAELDTALDIELEAWPPHGISNPGSGSTPTSLRTNQS